MKLCILLPVCCTNTWDKFHFVTYYTLGIMYFFVCMLLLAVGIAPRALITKVLKGSFTVIGMLTWGSLVLWLICHIFSH